MSKIICSICGTSYQENLTQCPICGCVRPADSVAVPENSQEAAGYTYVKGGRFSKSNVRRRSQAVRVEKNEKRPVNRKIVGLSIVLSFLVVIVGLMIFFIASGSFRNQNIQLENKSIPCTELTLFPASLQIDEIGSAVMLDAITVPERTTDKVTFESTNTKVVTVDEETGRVVCVGRGQAEIKVTCGEIVKSCRVFCDVEIQAEVKLLHTYIDDADFEGKTYILFNEEKSNVSLSELKWISDDPTVAIVDQSGNVTVVAEGSTTIRVEYKDETVASCEIVCKFTIPDNTMEDPEGGDSGVIPEESLIPYSHYATGLPFEEYVNAFTLTLLDGEWVGLFLQDPNNLDNKVEVVWEIAENSKGTCIIDPDGHGVTGVAGEDCRITARYGNTIYTIYIYQ